MTLRRIHSSVVFFALLRAFATKIFFVAVTQSLDISDRIGKILAGVLIGIADVELDHIKERQAAGIAEAKEKCIYTSREAGTLKTGPVEAGRLQGNGLKPG